MGANACRFSVTSPVYWLCVVFLVSWKKIHWWRPTKCAILHFLIKYLPCKRAAIQVCCMQIHRLSAKKEQKHVRQSTFFFLCGWLLRHKRHTVSLPKNKTRVYGVLSSLSECIKYSLYTSWSIGDRTAQINETFGKLMSRNYANLCEERIWVSDLRRKVPNSSTPFFDILSICRIRWD